MIHNLPTMTVPLQTDAQGAIRVGETRVLLEQVIHAYFEGETPEGIADRFSTLKLSDVYAVIGYYLDNPVEIDTYVRQRDARVEQTLHNLETHRSPESRAFRNRLRALRDQGRE